MTDIKSTDYLMERKEYGTSHSEFWIPVSDVPRNLIEHSLEHSLPL